MKKLTAILAAFIVSSLLLADCNFPRMGMPNTGGVPEVSQTAFPTIPVTGGTELVPELQTTPPPPAGETPSAQPSETNQVVTNTAAPSQTSSATTSVYDPVIPNTGSGAEQITSLAALFNGRVLDAAGKEIGIVHDFIVNLCEGHVVYLVVEPTMKFNQIPGWQMLVPYEALSPNPNGGAIDPGSNTYTLNVQASDLGQAPFAECSSS